MPVFKIIDPQLANTVTTNVMAGSKFEFLPRNGVVSVYAAQDTGTGILEVDFTLGNVVVGDGLPCNNVPVTTGPNRNQDLLAQGVAQAGDRIQIRTAETDGTATPFRMLVQINEL